MGRYTVFDPEKFATILVHVVAEDPAARYVVRLLDKNGRTVQERTDVRAGDVRFNYVAPGEVQLLVVEDRNGNGRWDTGSVVGRRQPERSELFVNEAGEDRFTTRANWEVELTIDTKRLFAPVTMQSLQRLFDERERQRLLREEEKRRREGKKRDHDHDTGNNRPNNNMLSTGNMFDSFR